MLTRKQEENVSIRKVGLAALWLLLATPACADTISGLVYADGSVDIPSSAYTIVHTRTEHYKVVFATPMSPKATCIVTPIGGKSWFFCSEDDHEGHLLRGDYRRPQ
jgi:hypothetical protein